MPSEHYGQHRYQRFPEIEQRIGENPARWLDRDILVSPNPGESHIREFVMLRIESIDFVDVARAFIEVEVNLDRDEAPRPAVVAALNERIQWLQENGERPRGGRVPHDAIPSTPSVVEWDTESGEQRTGAAVGGRR